MNNRVCRNGTPLDARHGNIALLRPRARLRPDPVRLHRRVARSAPSIAPGDPFLKTYEGVLPGFTVRQFLPEHQKPWLSWLAARGVDSSAGYPDIHRPARRRRHGDASSAGLFEGRDADGLSRRRIHPLAWRAGRAPWFAHISFISPHPPFIVPEPYNTMYDPADGPAFQRAGRLARAKLQPSLSRLRVGRSSRRRDFLPGMKGKVRDFDEDEFRRSARSITA